MRQVIIRNLTKQMKIFVLPHQIVCVKGGRCLCRNGSPASVHVPALRRSAAMPGAVCEAPDIKRALAKKEIAILAAPTKAEPKKDAPKTKKKDEPKDATDKGDDKGKKKK